MTQSNNEHGMPDSARHERSFDRYLLIGCTLALIVVIILLLGDFSLFHKQSARKSETVARIGDTKNKVRKRSSGLPVWSKAKRGEVVRDKDQVFTAENSNTVIEFVDGSQVELGENTLVTVEKQEKKTQFNVLRGALAAKSGDGGVEIEIGIGDMKTVVKDKNTEINVKKDEEGRTQIAVTGGNAKIASNGKVVELGPNQLSKFSADGKLTEITKIPVTLLLPKSGALKFYQRNSFSNAQTKFVWEEVEETKNYRIQVARDAYFKKRVVNRKISDTSVELKLRAGKYYWRVGALNKKSKKYDYSVERTLTLVEDRAPKLWKPARNGVVRYKEILKDDENAKEIARAQGALDGTRVNFFWEPLKSVDEYEIEIAEDSGFEDVVESEEVEKTTFRSKALEEGVYFWRVRVVDKRRPSSPWSVPQKFSVKQMRLPRQVATLMPQDDAEILLTKTPATVELSWNRVDLAHSYWIEIAKSKSFKDPTVKRKVLGTKYVWKPKSVGEFYWRVRPLDDFGRQTEFSDRHDIELDVGKPQLSIPEDQHSITLVEHRGPVNFSWKKVPLAKKYIFQISESKSFRRPFFQKEVTSPNVNWDKIKIGKYYWRIIVDVEGNDREYRSQPRLLEVTDLPLPEPPTLEPEIEIEVEAKFEDPKEHQWLGWFSLIPDAIAESPHFRKKPARIKWNPVKGGYSYQLEIARDKKFNSLIVKKQVMRPFFEWTKAYPGKFYMRVATVDKYNRKGRFSKPSVLVVRAAPPKPKVPSGNLRFVRAKMKTTFRWTEIKNTKTYKFQVSKRKDFSKIYETNVTPNTSQGVFLKKSGTYYWRVKAISSTGLETRYSKPFRFVYDYDPRDPDPEGGQTVTFRWDKVKRAQGYRLQVGKGRNVGYLIADEESFTNVYDMNLLPGTYYWRVASTKGSKQSRWTKPRKIIVRVPKDVAKAPSDARDPPPRDTAAAASGGGSAKTSKASAEDKARGDPHRLVIAGVYAPALNSYSQASNDPDVFFSGLNVVSFEGKIEFWHRSNTWGLGANYAQQMRTVLGSGQIGANQTAISLTRQKIWSGPMYSFAPFGSLPQLRAILRAGYQYKNLISFQTETSTSVQLVNTSVHYIKGGLGVEFPVTPKILSRLDLWYAYPFANNNINLSGALNFNIGAAIRYNFSPAFFMELAYEYELSRFSYTDDNDILTGGQVAGTIQDDNQFLGLVLGVNLNL